MNIIERDAASIAEHARQLELLITGALAYADEQDDLQPYTGARVPELLTRLQTRITDALRRLDTTTP